MPAMPVSVMDRVEREIARLPAQQDTSYGLGREVMERVADVLDLSGWCLSTADPDTLTMTSHTTQGVERRAAPVLYETEHAPGDVAGHRELAASRWPVRVLSRATDGRPECSRRYRELLRPLGIEHEMRVAVREGQTTWGFMHLFRERGARDFDADAAAFVERIARLLAPELRARIVGPHVEVVAAREAPALLLLDERLQLDEGTPGGHQWVMRLRDPEQPEGLPEVFMDLAVHARALLRDGSSDVARARVRDAAGAWSTVTATCTDRGRTAIIVQPSLPADLVPLMLLGFRLTPAERQVTMLVLDGRSTKQIAEELVVSPHTVQGHLKAVFDKVGVRSRRDLVARLHRAD